jgi:hypothetical protein
MMSDMRVTRVRASAGNPSEATIPAIPHMLMP